MGLTGYEIGRTDARLKLLGPVNNWSEAVFEEMKDLRSWPQESCGRRQTLSFQPLSRVRLFVTPGRLQHARLPHPTPSPRVCSHSSSRYHPIVLTHRVCGWFSTKWHFRATNMTLNYSSPWIRRKWGGRGSPLQYSRLVNPTDGGGWWAPVHGVAADMT